MSSISDSTVLVPTIEEEEQHDVAPSPSLSPEPKPEEEEHERKERARDMMLSQIDTDVRSLYYGAQHTRQDIVDVTYRLNDVQNSLDRLEQFLMFSTIIGAMATILMCVGTQK
jgi:hypothetical protein